MVALRVRDIRGDQAKSIEDTRRGLTSRNPIRTMLTRVGGQVRRDGQKAQSAPWATRERISATMDHMVALHGRAKRVWADWTLLGCLLVGGLSQSSPSRGALRRGDSHQNQLYYVRLQEPAPGIQQMADGQLFSRSLDICATGTETRTLLFPGGNGR